MLNARGTGGPCQTPAGGSQRAAQAAAPGEASRARGGRHCGRAWERSALGPSPRSTGLRHRLPQTSVPRVSAKAPMHHGPRPWPPCPHRQLDPTSDFRTPTVHDQNPPAYMASCRAELLQAGRCQAGSAPPQAETIEIGIGRRVRDAGGPDPIQRSNSHGLSDASGQQPAKLRTVLPRRRRRRTARRLSGPLLPS